MYKRIKPKTPNEAYSLLEFGKISFTLFNDADKFTYKR